jgi:hypothetical protein
MIAFWKEELKDFFRRKKYFNITPLDFIEPDPISVPARYSLKEDIEIVFGSTNCLGYRKMIVVN